MFTDWYAVLAVEPGADEPTLRRAYRKAALKYHPDKNQDARASDQFGKLNEALEVLLEPKRRKEFDAERSQWLEKQRSSEDVRMLKRKLVRQEQLAKARYSRQDLERLRQEGYERRRALDAMLNSGAADPSSRTLHDGSKVFATVAEARRYVDTHPGARLKASHKARNYTPEYERDTLERLKLRRQDKSL